LKNNAVYSSIYLLFIFEVIFIALDEDRRHNVFFFFSLFQQHLASATQIS